MDKQIRAQIRFALEDDNELMSTALNGDLDRENKQMNRKLIKKHEQILTKLEKDEQLSQEDLQLVRDANQIHLNDTEEMYGHHKQAVQLDTWLNNMIELSKDEAIKILEKYLDGDTHTPVKVYRALHTLWEEATPNGMAKKPAFDDKGKCLKCGSKVSFADVTDTLVFVGDEIVKRYDGDITNKNCVKCTYPKQYVEYEPYDEPGSANGDKPE